MKISMIGPVYPYRGGIAHYTAVLAQALVRGGHQVQLISFKRQYPALLYPGKTDKDPSADPIRVEAQYLLDPFYPWTWRKAARAILANQPTIALFQWWTTVWAPAYTGLTRQIRNAVRIVYLIHNVVPHESRPWDRWLARMALSQAQAFIVQAPHEQQKLLALIPHARIRYCNHPNYPRFSAGSIPKSIAREQLGLPTDRPVFLFFGIVRPYKGLKYLIEALAHVGAPVHLAIAGDFWDDVTSYQKQIEALQLGPRITLMNRYIPNEEAHILFSAVDAFVAPYVDGTQSGAVGQALGYDLPIIVTDKIAAGIDVDAGLVKVVPAADAAALAAGISEVVQSLPQGRADPSRHDDWRRLVKVIEEIEATGLTSPHADD